MKWESWGVRPSNTLRRPNMSCGLVYTCGAGRVHVCGCVGVCVCGGGGVHKMSLGFRV